jgi:hypothetical protein
LERAGAPVGFDLLVIDVEGAERQVFASFDLEKWMPKTLLVELEDEHPDFLDNQRVVRDAGMIRSRIEAAGYRDISAITSTRSMLEMMCSKTQNPKWTLRNWLESRALRCPGDPCLGRSKRGVTGVEPVEPGHVQTPQISSPRPSRISARGLHSTERQGGGKARRIPP